jgi:hypothetical protein
MEQVQGSQRKTAEPTVCNGINVDDLFALIDGVRRDTAKGKTNTVQSWGRIERGVPIAEVGALR